MPIRRFSSKNAKDDYQKKLRALEVLRARINAILRYHKVLNECTPDEQALTDDGYEHLNTYRIQYLRDRIRDRMTPEDSLSFGQILGRTLWNSWNHLPSRVCNAIRSCLGMEFSFLVQLGYFPELQEDPESGKSRSKMYILKQPPRSPAKFRRNPQRYKKENSRTPQTKMNKSEEKTSETPQD